jgi:hypothetical protein
MTDNGNPEPTAPDTVVLVHGFWVTPAAGGAARGSLPDRGPDHPRHRRALRGHHRRARFPGTPALLGGCISGNLASTTFVNKAASVSAPARNVPKKQST